MKFRVKVEREVRYEMTVDVEVDKEWMAESEAEDIANNIWPMSEWKQVDEFVQAIDTQRLE
jgi:hypothetical protein